MDMVNPMLAMKHPDYPGVSSMTDRHGKIRWRYRKYGRKDEMMPGEPHSIEFDARYEEIITGRPKVVKLPGMGHPHSLKAAYRLLKKTPEWLSLDDKSQRRYQQTIERILFAKLGSMEWGDGPIPDLRRQHVKAILSIFADAPHMERIVLLCLRKLLMVALDEEWIDTDPSYGLRRAPHTNGHKTWPAEMMARYEARWPVGTRQRTAYALALWLGNRVSDVARLEWSHLTTKHITIDGETRAIEGFEFVQWKGRKRGKALFLPMTKMLAQELAPLSRETGTVLVSSRGTSYQDNALSKAMGEWSAEAGLGPGYTMHGLRKALGAKLAEADASTRQIMEVLGHSSIAYAELYSREASQLRLAMQAMDKVSRNEGSRLKLVE